MRDHLLLLLIVIVFECFSESSLAKLHCLHFTTSIFSDLLTRIMMILLAVWIMLSFQLSPSASVDLTDSVLISQPNSSGAAIAYAELTSTLYLLQDNFDTFQEGETELIAFDLDTEEFTYDEVSYLGYQIYGEQQYYTQMNHYLYIFGYKFQEDKSTILQFNVHSNELTKIPPSTLEEAFPTCIASMSVGDKDYLFVFGVEEITASEFVAFYLSDSVDGDSYQPFVRIFDTDDREWLNVTVPSLNVIRAYGSCIVSDNLQFS